MLVSIPPKYSVSQFVGYLKGKSGLMIESPLHRLVKICLLYDVFSFAVVRQVIFKINSGIVPTGCNQAFFGLSVFAFLGFMLQNTTFITITISTTTAMDTQKPILRPSHSVVPKRVIQISFQFILTPP